MLSRIRNASGVSVAVVYLALSLLDMLLSLAAFGLGVAEANPVLAWCAARGLFVPVKAMLTALAAVLIAVVYRRGRAYLVAWSSALLMAGVVAYHLWGLSAL